MECEAYKRVRIGSGAPRIFGTHRQVHFTAEFWVKLSRQLVVQSAPRASGRRLCSIGRAIS